ncbi:MAG: NUDIX domain-containing protein, partial [Gammaproteobacteria bacterium]
KRSHCAFVVVKLRIEGGDYLLMRRDPDWRDISFLGGHASERDRGKLERTARRELLEELPALRSLAHMDLKPLTEEFTYGPVYSPSAKSQVLYHLRFFSLVFGENPGPIVESLGTRTPNTLIRQADLSGPSRHKVAALVGVLAHRIDGGLASLPYSWSKDLGRFCHSPHEHQFELSLE